jgi:peptide deformylase
VENDEVAPHDVMPITLYGNAILRRRAPDVVEFGAELAALIDQMFETLYATEHGVGLSANQVGRTERVFIFDLRDGQIGHVVNPVVTVGSELERDDEACLSVPGIGLTTTRSSSATVRGVDKVGAPVEYDGVGLMARCFQHELDHLNGKLYIDHHPAEVRKRVERAVHELPWYGNPALDPRSELYAAEPPDEAADDSAKPERADPESAHAEPQDPESEGDGRLTTTP